MATDATQQNGAKLAMVTGASTGIGYHLADECAKHGYELIVAADEPQIEKAAQALETRGVKVTPVQADLATMEGVDKLYEAAQGRKIDILIANAGIGLGKGFLEQDCRA
jgi:short-subunit dehydrogenase